MQSRKIDEMIQKSFTFGIMGIPNNIVFYQKQYVYAMVPLVQKLQGRNS